MESKAAMKWMLAWGMGCLWAAFGTLADEIPPYSVHSGPSDSSEAGGRGTPPTVWRDEACPSLPERGESHSHARVAGEPETLLDDTDAVGFVFTSPKCHLGGNLDAPQQEAEP